MLFPPLSKVYPCVALQYSLQSLLPIRRLLAELELHSQTRHIQSPM
jgi:hypothetical protein